MCIALDDLDKIAFKCPFGSFAYRKISFGVCNAPVTFYRCMTVILSNLVHTKIEVFMDDLSVFGGEYDKCLD